MVWGRQANGPHGGVPMPTFHSQRLLFAVEISLSHTRARGHIRRHLTRLLPKITLEFQLSAKDPSPKQSYMSVLLSGFAIVRQT